MSHGVIRYRLPVEVKAIHFGNFFKRFLDNITKKVTCNLNEAYWKILFIKTF